MIAIRYDVALYTGDGTGIGVQANLFLQIFGPNGKTGEIPLRNKHQLFEHRSVSIMFGKKKRFSNETISDLRSMDLQSMHLMLDLLKKFTLVTIQLILLHRGTSKKYD